MQIPTLVGAPLQAQQLRRNAAEHGQKRHSVREQWRGVDPYLRGKGALRYASVRRLLWCFLHNLTDIARKGETDVKIS
jgi:hypothetical protein